MGKRTGRFWIFAFDSYYPSGGMGDFVFSFDTLKEYEEKVRLYNDERYSKFEDGFDHYELLDTETKYDFHVHRHNLQSMKTWVSRNE